MIKFHPEMSDELGTAALPDTQYQLKDADPQMSAGNLINTRLHQFAEEVTVIGVKQAADRSIPWHRRTVWALLVLGSLCLAAYQIQDRVWTYAGFPTSIAVNIVPADLLDFPQVTICNENKFMKQKAEELEIAAVLSEMFPLFPVYSNNPNISILADRNYSQEQWEEINLNLSQPISTAVPFPPIFGLETLTVSNLTSIYTDMGLCFAFNTALDNYTTIQQGALFGLRITLYAGQEQYLVANSPAAGFRIAVHEKVEIPLLQETGYFVAPGGLTSIALQLQNKTDIGEPYGNCNTSAEYRRINCQINCSRDFLIAYCSCKFAYMPGTERNCTILEQYTCAQAAFSQFAQEGFQLCKCIPECYSKTYQYFISSSILSDIFITYITGRFPNLNSTELLKNYVTVQIFFSTLKYTDVVASPGYLPMALLSDIGGALGLMLGATILTLYECAEFLVGLIRQLVLLKRRKPSNTISNGVSMSETGLKR